MHSYVGVTYFLHHFFVFLAGGSLMIKPVLEQYATSVQLYLPGNNAVRSRGGCSEEGRWEGAVRRGGRVQ